MLPFASCERHRHLPLFIAHEGDSESAADRSRIFISLQGLAGSLQRRAHDGNQAHHQRRYTDGQRVRSAEAIEMTSRGRIRWMDID